MAPEKRKTLVLGRSVVYKNTIDFYISKGFFKDGDCRPQEGEIIPAPKEGKVVVFRDFFKAGLRLHVDPVVPLLLAPFNMKLHHLTPNVMVQLSKFLWAVRTFSGEVSVDAFYRLFKLRCQARKIIEEGKVEPSEAQNACCTFVPRKNNKKAKLQRIGLSSAHKNKWEDDWVRYWSYAKVKLSKPESPSEVYYPLAALKFLSTLISPGSTDLLLSLTLA
jgi:hypothetical protein